MSDAGKFVALAIPDAIEAGTKAAINAGLISEGKPKKPRKPRMPGSFSQPNLQKETPAVTTASPQEIQKSLNAELEAYVDARLTPERKAEALIKIGSYRVELQKYLPILTNADEDLRNEVLEQWFQGGDIELRKMVFNATAGSEELPLSKAAPPMGPVAELAKMVDSTPEGPPRMAMLQKMGIYAQQVSEFWDRAEAEQMPGETRDQKLEAWINEGDRSHAEMKKAISASEAQRRASTQGVSHKDILAFTAGNAATHASAKLGGSENSDTPDSGIRRTVPKKSKGEGDGPRMPDTKPAPGQANGDSPNPKSGPNDTGEGGVKVAAKVTRKGTTGGLGSVAGAEDPGKPTLPSNDHVQDDDDDDADTDYSQDRKRRKKAAEKNASLATDLMKIMSDDFHQAMAKYSAKDQQMIVNVAADHAADLLAWSAKGGGKLQKRSLDSAVTQWLSDDPDAVDLKKFVAEALATAEQIPLELGQAIMAWEPEKPKLTKVAWPRLVKSGAKPKLVVRQPYDTMRAA